eukprot:COSAG04_NODE_502_length_13354_cov_548.289777_9_plen_251_part_00
MATCAMVVSSRWIVCVSEYVVREPHLPGRADARVLSLVVILSVTCSHLCRGIATSWWGRLHARSSWHRGLRCWGRHCRGGSRARTWHRGWRPKCCRGALHGSVHRCDTAPAVRAELALARFRLAVGGILLRGLRARRGPPRLGEASAAVHVRGANDGGGLRGPGAGVVQGRLGGRGAAAIDRGAGGVPCRIGRSKVIYWVRHCLTLLVHCRYASVANTGSWKPRASNLPPPAPRPWSAAGDSSLGSKPFR